MLISAEKLHALTKAIVQAGGSGEDEAEQVAAQLLSANLGGHDSHGIGMIPAYMRSLHAGNLHPGHSITVKHRDGAFCLVDGNAGYGQVVARQTMELGLEIAAEHGVAVIGLTNAHHIGRVGAWGEICAAAGMVSVHWVNGIVHALVTPYGGSDARYTTNPHCTAIPTADGKPIVLDMATSNIAMGKVRVAYNKGVDVPEGSLIDADGNPTNDPSVMFSEPKGALRSMGLHKGYGMALVCEVLAGAFTGGGVFTLDRTRQNTIINNMLTVILDPSRFGGLDAFQGEVAALSASVKSSPPAPGFDEVMVPGDPERKARAERLAEGVPVDDNTWAELVEAAASVGIEEPEVRRIIGN